MRLHYIQHAPFEGPGSIASWANARGHKIVGTQIYRGQSLPSLDDFDLLVVLGGPMNVYEEGKHPWLFVEKHFIKEAADAGKHVLGVCLGAQLISVAFGGRVTRNKHREIGWYVVTVTPAGRRSAMFRGFPQTFTPMHWHGDTFTVPASCTLTASSEACANQAFEGSGGRVVGVQFHLDYGEDDIATMVREDAAELETGRFVQAPELMLGRPENVGEGRRLLYLLLDNILSAL